MLSVGEELKYGVVVAEPQYILPCARWEDTFEIRILDTMLATL